MFDYILEICVHFIGILFGSYFYLIGPLVLSYLLLCLVLTLVGNRIGVLDDKFYCPDYKGKLKAFFEADELRGNLIFFSAFISMFVYVGTAGNYVPGEDGTFIFFVISIIQNIGDFFTLATPLVKYVVYIAIIWWVLGLIKKPVQFFLRLYRKFGD